MTNRRFAALLAIVCPAGFAFAWHAMDTGNGHVVAAVAAYLLAVFTVLSVVLYRRLRKAGKP